MNEVMMESAVNRTIGPDTLPLMITPKQAMEITGLPYDCILQLCKEGKVPHIRRGDWRYKINRIKLVEYLDTAGLAEEKPEAEKSRGTEEPDGK